MGIYSWTIRQILFSKIPELSFTGRLMTINHDLPVWRPSCCSGGIFRDHHGFVLGFFSAYLGIHSALYAKCVAIILALEKKLETGLD